MAEKNLGAGQPLPGDMINVDFARGLAPAPTPAEAPAPWAGSQQERDYLRALFGDRLGRTGGAASADSRYNTELRTFTDSMARSADATRADGGSPDHNWHDRHRAASQAVTDLGLGGHWK